ncbi:MAG: glycosyltransferase [Candidatus Reddybacter sp.]
MHPLVSFIIPAYNHERFVIKCLNSIRDDSYPNKELVIIDDGSIDDTTLVIRDWIANEGGALDIKFNSRDNRGVTATLNELVNISKGKYIVPIASDDYLLNHTTKLRVDYLEKNKNKFAVFGDCVIVDDSGAIVNESGLTHLRGGNIDGYRLDDSLAYEIIMNWSIPGPVLMVDRGLFGLVGQYDETIPVEDWDFYLRMVSVNALGFIDKKVSAYRIHADNACKDQSRLVINHKASLASIVRNIKRFKGKNRILAMYRSLYFVALVLRSLVINK